MESSMLLEFVGTLRKTQKLFFRNFKLLSCIILLIVSLCSILFVSNIFSIRPPITDFTRKAGLLAATSPGTPEFANLLITLKDDLRLFAGLESIFIVAFFFAALFFSTAAILATEVTYCGKDLTVKELLSRAVKSLKRPFVTQFYITLLDLGYTLFLLAFLLPLVLIFNLPFTTPAFYITKFILALVFKAYLAVVWNLAVVVSVLEEKCGIEALGKAGQLIQGSRLRGYFLNLFFGAFSLSVFYGLHKIGTRVMSENAVLIPVLLLDIVTCLIRMSMLMAYTVLYYECKETHGEALDMKGSTEFTKVAFSPLISADVP